MVRLIGIGVVSGACLVHHFTRLPALDLLLVRTTCLALCVVLLSWLLARQTPVRAERRTFVNVMLSLLWATLALMLSVCWTIYLAQGRLADELDPIHENVVTRLTFRVTSMRQEREQSQSFEVAVLDPAPAGIPRHLQVVWQDAPSQRVWGADHRQESAPLPASVSLQVTRPQVLPGQVWRAALVLRRPHGASNPFGFDYEGLMFQRNIRAIGKVRGWPKLLADDGYITFAIAVDRIRQHIRTAMLDTLDGARFGPVMVALAIGDQNGVKQEDWEVFNQTGITHLVSISGSHVTMFGALGGFVALFLFKRLKFRGKSCCEFIPARTIAALCAMLVAFLYCLLAGWGVPARRTFLMLTVTAFAVVFKLPFSGSHVLLAAAACVTALDPWAPLSTGFWLSFFAVGILIHVATQPLARDLKASRMRLLLHGIKEATRLQWLITLAMLPILAYLFQQISLSSPLANAIAIPVMSFIVTPLALMTALLSLIPLLSPISGLLAWLGHQALVWMMYPIYWLAQADWAMQYVRAFPVGLLLLALLGLVWSMQVPGLSMRWAGWTLMLPAMVWHPARLRHGEWSMTVFDVGQGAAVLISTSHHHLLYDTGQRIGASDAAARVLLPSLRALGVKQLDWLIVSHGDLDHAGGLTSILKGLPVLRLLSSAGVEKYLSDQRLKGQYPPVNAPCEAGQRWELDGVFFQILNSDDSNLSLSTNARSCILKIHGAHHRALLPGDIGTNEESRLIASHDISSDVVLMPHHGSKTSSSISFVSLSGARHAVAQVGYLNRFRHPDPLVIQRWERANTQTWRTDQHGALFFKSTQQGLSALSWRDQMKRYWHHRSPP
jgi:competence protein ComEC